MLLVAIGALVAFRQRADLRAVLRPLTVHTPLAAFELGLDPLVHRFVASLEAKDPVTRDHVVRSAELAMAVGAQLGIRADDLHVLGLGALLHDVGKLTLPDSILTKPSRLDDSEYAIVKGHAAAGEALEQVRWCSRRRDRSFEDTTSDWTALGIPTVWRAKRSRCSHELSVCAMPSMQWRRLVSIAMAWARRWRSRSYVSTPARSGILRSSRRW